MTARIGRSRFPVSTTKGCWSKAIAPMCSQCRSQAREKPRARGPAISIALRTLRSTTDDRPIPRSATERPTRRPFTSPGFSPASRGSISPTVHCNSPWRRTFIFGQEALGRRWNLRAEELFPRPAFDGKGPRAKSRLLIPTRDRADLLRPCLQSLERTIGMKDNELIVINNDSSDPDALACIETAAEQGARVVNVKGPYNFARLIGAAASVAIGDFLLVMSNDVEAVSEDWLDEMLRRAAEPDVGAVGATLLWPSGVVRHAGIVLGMGLAAGFASDDRVDGDPGYSDRLIVAHECSAVSGACLLTRRSLFHALNGFDGSRFPTDYGDIDYCLRLRASGYRVVMAPQSQAFAPGVRPPRKRSGNRRCQQCPIRTAQYARRLGRGPVGRSLLQPDAVYTRQPIFGARMPAAFLCATRAPRRSSSAGPDGVVKPRLGAFALSRSFRSGFRTV